MGFDKERPREWSQTPPPFGQFGDTNQDQDDDNDMEFNFDGLPLFDDIVEEFNEGLALFDQFDAVGNFEVEGGIMNLYYTLDEPNLGFGDLNEEHSDVESGENNNSASDYEIGPFAFHNYNYAPLHLLLEGAVEEGDPQYDSHSASPTSLNTTDEEEDVIHGNNGEDIEETDTEAVEHDYAEDRGLDISCQDQYQNAAASSNSGERLGVELGNQAEPATEAEEERETPQQVSQNNKTGSSNSFDDLVRRRQMLLRQQKENELIYYPVIFLFVVASRVLFFIAVLMFVYSTWFDWLMENFWPPN